MTRTPTADSPTADLVARTLQAVADAVPVDDRPAAPRPISELPTASAAEPRRPRGRRGRSVAVLGAAAALVVAVLAVRAGSDGNDTRPATDMSDPASVQFVPDWLPDDVTTDVGPMGRAADSGLQLAAALLTSPDGTGEVLVASVERTDGQPIGEQQIVAARSAVETPTARLDDSGAEGRDGARGWVAVSRGSASRDDALAAGAALMDDAAWDDVLPGWTPQLVPLGWLPDIAPLHGTRFAGADRAVDVLAVAADLPDADVLRTLLVDARTVTVRDRQGWISSLPGSQSDMLVWQEARGLVGALISEGLSHDDLVRLADELQLAEQPSAGDPAVRVVAAGDVGGMAYRIELRDGLADLGESRCVTLHVDGVRTGPLCGLDEPDMPFLQIGPVDRNDEVTLVWGVLGADVREVTAAPPASVSAPALPLDPDDPASMRYVLLALPAQGSPTDITLSDAEGHPLATTTIDPQAAIGG